MTPAKLLRHRLHHQRLAATNFEDPAEPVRWLGAVQAQDYLGSLWAIALRTRAATERVVERAIAERAAAEGLGMAGSELASFDLADRKYWASPATPPDGSSPRAFLLPAFDEYTVAYRDRGAVVQPAHARYAKGMDLLRPAVVVNGRVVGTWTRNLAGSSVEVGLTPFTPLGTTARRAVTAAARRYAAFLELSADVC